MRQSPGAHLSIGGLTKPDFKRQARRFPRWREKPIRVKYWRTR